MNETAAKKSAANGVYVKLRFPAPVQSYNGNGCAPSLALYGPSCRTMSPPSRYTARSTGHSVEEVGCVNA